MFFSSSRGAPRGSFLHVAGFESGQKARESITHTQGEFAAGSWCELLGGRRIFGGSRPRILTGGGGLMAHSLKQTSLGVATLDWAAAIGANAARQVDASSDLISIQPGRGSQSHARTISSSIAEAKSPAPKTV